MDFHQITFDQMTRSQAQKVHFWVERFEPRTTLYKMFWLLAVLEIKIEEKNSDFVFIEFICMEKYKR